MVICKVSDLAGTEKLAQAVLNDDYQIILKKGTILKKSYIEKLIELGIDEVAIVNDKQDEEITILREEIAETFKDKVQSILEKHVYHHSSELEVLCKEADAIISNILEEEHVVEKIYDIKERNADVYEHSISICTLATLTALKLGFEKNKIHDLGTACLLHDLGLRYLTIKYDNQNIEDLNNVELSEYKKHTVYAYSVLKNETWITEEAKQMILYHHERMDGTGFPLKARECSKETRLIQICDAFDEMICGIGCKRVKVYEAVEYLKNFEGIKFDKEITETFLTLIAVYPVGTTVRTNEGEVGTVIRQNKHFPERPVIQITYDKNGEEVKETVEKDLLKILNIVITDVVE